MQNFIMNNIFAFTPSNHAAPLCLMVVFGRRLQRPAALQHLNPPRHRLWRQNRRRYCFVHFSDTSGAEYQEDSDANRG